MKTARRYRTIQIQASDSIIIIIIIAADPIPDDLCAALTKINNVPEQCALAR